MIEQILIEEHRPYPNSRFPVLIYPNAMKDVLTKKDPSQQVMDFLEDNHYANAWVNGIFPYHHFHTNTHEVLACIEGEAAVQLGGPDGKEVTFSKGDVLLLPAGTAHKRLKASKDFQIVGAYPNGNQYNTYKEDDFTSEGLFEQARQEVKEVPAPDHDPIQGLNGAVQKYWV